jgi:hypothetical protein
MEWVEVLYWMKETVGIESIEGKEETHGKEKK